MKQALNKIYLLCFFCLTGLAIQAQDGMPVKTTTDITIDKVGNAVCEFKTKYSAMYWDVFLKTVGSNTSILKNQLIKAFPKYELTDFNYSQDADERTNSIKFKMLGVMNVDKNGKWTTDLDQKNPDITKLSVKDYLLIEEGNSLKIHLPEGTTDSKIEKNTFGKAILTYPADMSGPMGNWALYLGLGMLVAGGFLLFRKMQKQRTAPAIYIPANNRIDSRDNSGHITQPRRVDSSPHQNEEVPRQTNPTEQNRPHDNI